MCICSWQIFNYLQDCSYLNVDLWKTLLSLFFFQLQQSYREFEYSCVLNVLKNGTLDVLTSDIQLVCFCASSQIDYWTEFVIKVWPYNTDLLPWERAKWISSRKLHLNPTVECTSRKAGLKTLKWCIWVDVPSLWVGTIELLYLWRMSLDKCLVFLIIIMSWT